MAGAAALGFAVFPTAIGPCALAWTDSAIAGAQLPEADAAALRQRMVRRFAGAAETPPPARVAAWLARIQQHLRDGHDPLLDLPLDWQGLSGFDRRVYEAARAIAPGRTVSYGELATTIGEAGAARAVGQALGRNPFAPVVPCHRVLAAHGGAGGFSATGGVVSKLRLLRIEAARIGRQPDLFGLAEAPP